MSEALDEFVKTMGKESKDTPQIIERLMAAADSARVFSPPVTSGEYTVITAAEVGSGGGFGSGMGVGPANGVRGKKDKKDDTAGEDEGALRGMDAGFGAGRGGGGGGASMGRPVATIVIGPDGVDVRPVVDVTKVGLAALTALGALGTLTLKVVKEQLRTGGT